MGAAAAHTLTHTCDDGITRSKRFKHINVSFSLNQAGCMMPTVVAKNVGKCMYGKYHYYCGTLVIVVTMCE